MNLRKWIILPIAILMIMLLAGGARAWRITKELEQELDQKKKAVEQNPNSPHAHFDLAITYAYTNHIEEGLDELKKVDEIDKNYAPVALELYSKEAETYPNLF